jgi:hypothetical protein
MKAEETATYPPESNLIESRRAEYLSWHISWILRSGLMHEGQCRIEPHSQPWAQRYQPAYTLHLAVFISQRTDFTCTEVAYQSRNDVAGLG